MIVSKKNHVSQRSIRLQHGNTIYDIYASIPRPTPLLLIYTLTTPLINAPLHLVCAKISTTCTTSYRVM